MKNRRKRRKTLRGKETRIIKKSNNKKMKIIDLSNIIVTEWEIVIFRDCRVFKHLEITNFVKASSLTF